MRCFYVHGCLIAKVKTWGTNAEFKQTYLV